MQSWEGIIRRVPLFASLTEEDFKELFPLVKVKGCLGGVYLFEKGEPSDSFFVISSGSVRIELPPDKAGKVRSVTLKQGDFFGEMGVLRCTPRSADAFIVEDSTVLQIMKDDFDELMAVNTGLAERVMATFMSRMEEATRPPGDLSVAPPERKCHVYSFFSPSGGAGTSFLAANIALKARDMTQKKVLLVDADFQCSSLHVMLDTQSAQPSASIAQEGSIDGGDFPRYVQQLHLGLDFLPGPATVEEAALFTPAVCRSLVANAADQYDYIFIDTPSSLHEPNLTIFQESDQIFLVFNPDMVSVTRVRSALDALARAGLDRSRVRLVLNKYMGDKGLDANKLEESFEQRIFGRIMFEPEEVVASINQGLPLVRRTPRSPVSVDICRAVRQLLSISSTDGEEREGESFSLWHLFK